MSSHDPRTSPGDSAGPWASSSTPGGSGDEFQDVDPSQYETLHPQDEAALDALASAHFRMEAVEESQRPIARGLSDLLSLLDRGTGGSPEGRQALVDVTLARVAQARRQERRGGTEPALSWGDDEALEALIAAEYDVERVPGAQRYRAKRAANLLGLLGGVVTGSAADGSLVERTLSRVQRAIEEHEDRLTVATRQAEAPRARGLSIRLADAMSAAALLFIGFMLVAPMLLGMRAYNQQQACMSNMHSAGVAFDAYAGDFRSRLPVASRAPAGTSWWNVGDPEHSNSANLFLLRRANYAPTIEILACCGNPQAPRVAQADWVDWPTLNQVSYSYQNQFAERRARWEQGRRVVILADASPVVRRAIRNGVILPFENSANHDERGQNVLLNDGTGVWLATPNLPFGRGDNIWLPRNIEAEIARLGRRGETFPIEGTEEPEREDDSFVGP
ncbi:MAG: hypothetical protein AB7G11_11450 [Phycisphaerales bacterium]